MSSTTTRKSFYETVTDAVADLEEHGYDRATRVAEWVRKIRAAAQRDLASERDLTSALTRILRSTYDKMVGNAQIERHHKVAQKFTLAKVKPKLRAELDRRIVASANLIKLNREQAIEKTLQRFQGWATSIPAGGTKVAATRTVKNNVATSIKQLPFEERRVIIDQGHKFAANLNDILATENKSIAFIWHSQYRQKNYNYREEHKERDGKVYAIRGSWADQKGFVNKGDGYTDEMTKPGEEVFCRCYVTYLYDLADLPSDMLTQKGKNQVERAKEIRRQLRESA